MKNTIFTIIVGLMAVVIIVQHCAIKGPSSPVSGQTPAIETYQQGFNLKPGESKIVSISVPLDLEQIFGLNGGIRFTDLLDAIEQVESGGDPNAIGLNGEVGSFQLKKIYVDEVNRIFGIEGYSKRYNYADRLDSFSSRVMTVVHCGYWHNEYFPYKYFGLKSNVDLEIAEHFTRIHNGGPGGWKKKSTKPYWEKVKVAIQTEPEYYKR